LVEQAKPNKAVATIAATRRDFADREGRDVIDATLAFATSAS